MKSVWSYFIALLMICSPQFLQEAKASECADYTQLRDFRGKEIRLRNNTLLFSTDILKIDIDGSKRSYGIHDQGVEGICNGLSPVSPKRCQNAFQRTSNGCFPHCKAKFREWHSKGHKIADLHKYMRSIGLGGAKGSVPNVKLQPAPNQEMFVSHTSVKYGPWKRGESLEKIEKQSAQIEPFEVPFFVIPGKFRQLRWDATPGDFGVAVHAQDPSRYALFVVGDVGGNLDEGSAKLQELLRGEPLKPGRRTNLLGKKVDDFGNLSYTRFAPGQQLDLRVAIFRHTSSFDRTKSGARIVLQKAHSQDEILKQIGEEAGRLLAEFGGAEMVVACTNGS